MRSRPQQTIQRRGSRNYNEDRIEMLRSRVGLLRGQDRVLIQMYLDNENTFRQMARLAGVNEATIARRIHKVVKRLLDGSYITCLYNKETLTPRQLEMARDYFVDGLPMREIADRHEVSIYRVRKNLQRIQSLIEVGKNNEKL